MRQLMLRGARPGGEMGILNVRAKGEDALRQLGPDNTVNKSPTTQRRQCDK